MGSRDLSRKADGCTKENPMRDRRSRKPNGEVAAERGIKSGKKGLVSNGKYYKLKRQRAACVVDGEELGRGYFDVGVEDFQKFASLRLVAGNLRM